MAQDGVRLHGWFVAGTRDVTWLWLHGNAGNITHRLENLALLHHRLGVNILLFDYRGYGLSQGKPSERGTYRDGLAALAYLRGRGDVDPQKTVLFGRSLGGAVAVEMATREPCHGLILESPFTSVKDMARLTFPWLPLGPLLRTKYDSLSKIGRVRAPVLVLHGDRDEVIPFEQGVKLYQAASEPKEFYAIHGAGHNDTYRIGGEGYLRALETFMQSLAQRAMPPGDTP